MNKRLLLIMVLSVTCCISALAQKKVISGVVKDDTGEGLPGVSVTFRGADSRVVGVITDLYGKFTLKNVTPKTVVKFSAVGMAEQRVTVGNQKTLDITMKEDSKLLDDVVVIGYGKVTKKEATGAVAHLGSDEFKDVVSSDLGTALQGKVAGLNVVASSGEPGANSQILIRGVNSLNGANTPLYVVDGIPQEGDPMIATNEIQSIDVLKDAASCAIYGTRGAGGVIIITTKQGSAGSVKVNFDASYGIRHIAEGTPLMDATEQCYFETVFYRNITGSLDDEAPLDASKYPYYIQNDNKVRNYAIRNNKPTQTYNINITGGNKTTFYNVVAGYYREKGNIINADFQRLNTRANLTYNNKRVHLNGSIGVTLEDKDLAAGSIIMYTLSYKPTSQDLDLSDDDQEFVTSSANQQKTSWILNSFKSKNNVKTTKALASLNFRYDITKYLNFSLQGSANVSNAFTKKFMPKTKLTNEYDGSSMNTTKDSYVINTSGRNDSYIFNATLNYKRKIGSHNLGATLAATTEQYDYNGFTAQRYDVANNSIMNLNGAVGDQIATGASDYTNKLIGFIFRSQYDWKSRYLLSASVRRDGSSRFAKSNRWGTFPSASAAWNVSEEPFWKSAKKVVNNFKIRTSYGTTGNQGFSPYSFSPTIVTGFDYAFGAEGSGSLSNGAAMSSYANSNIKWETSKQFNVGADLYFLNNRFTFSVDYYSTSKSDMLYPVTLPLSTGTTSTVMMNVGNMTNKGVEFALGYNQNIGKLRMEMNATLSTNENKLSKFNELSGVVMCSNGVLVSGSNDYSKCTAFVQGKPAGAFYLYKTNGIADTPEKLAEYQAIVPTAKMGDLIRVDTNNDGEITEADRQYCGSGMPKFEIGYNCKLKYRNFDFTMNWYAALGQKVMNGAKCMAYSYGRHRDLVYAWSPQNPVTSIPAYRGTMKDHFNYRGDSDLWLENGTFLRLKTATLGYTLPKAFTAKFGVTGLRFYATAQNPLTITKYSGYDPEIGGSVTRRGLDAGNYPVTSLYVFGLNLNF